MKIVVVFLALNLRSVQPFDDCLASNVWSEDALALGDDPLVLKIAARNFRHVVSQGYPVLLNLYTPTCPHSRALMPHVRAVAEQLRASKSSVRVATVDCAAEQLVCRTWLGVRGIGRWLPSSGQPVLSPIGQLAAGSSVRASAWASDSNGP